MPLNLALNSALTGLLTSQTALDTISNNLANLDNPNYTKKTVTESEVTLNGQGAGVKIDQIARDVDQQLDTNLNQANGGLNQFQTVADYYSQIQNLFGAPGDGSALSQQIQNLTNALQTQANTPGQTPSAVVQSAQDITNVLSNMSTQVQQLRTKADQTISTDVSQVNSILQNISTLNSQIALNQATGTGVSDLQDQRDAQVSQLTTYMNVSVFNRGDGTISIYTTQGTPLLDTKALTVDHGAASTLSPSLSFAAGQVQGVTVNGVDITSQITSGQIASLLQMRDTTLPNLQTQLDTVGQSLATGFNQINNAGISWPNGGQAFTGSKQFTLPQQQTISMTGGDTTVALLNSDGSQAGATTVSLMMEQYMQSQNLPTTTPWTVTDVAAGMNSWLNGQFNTSGITYAQINSSGQFQINLPQTGGTTLALKDTTTQTYQSQTSADPTVALGFTGPLTFRDDAGNVITANIAATDSLNDIATKLNAQGFVTASVVENAQGSGSQLVVTDNANANLYVDPDAQGNTVQAGLGMLPAGTNPQTNVNIGFNADNLGTSFTSAEYDPSQTVSALNAGGQALGISGKLVFADKSGTIGPSGGINITSGMSLSDIASAIQSGSSGLLTASVISVGNQVALHVVDAAGNQVSVTGSPASNTTANPVVALGLQPPADETDQGFSNFLGLNDMFVNSSPVIGYQSQTLTNGFLTGSSGNLEIADSSWQNGAPTLGGTPGLAGGTPQALNISFKQGLSLQAMADQINQQAVAYDGNHVKPNGFSAQGGTITIESGIDTLGGVVVPQGTSINDIAAMINANPTLQQSGVQAIVATDGTNQWLRVYDQQGRPLEFSGNMIGNGGGQLALNQTQLVNAAVVNDGSGQRLQIQNSVDTPLQVTGTMTSQINLAPSVAGEAQNIQVRSDIAANPSLLSQGTLQYDTQSGSYFAGQNDNTSTVAMANFLTNPVQIPSAGGLGQGQYSLTQYASNIIAATSTAASNNNTQLTYQQTLVQNLTTQKGALSGVNLDEELSNMITYQQAYTASARVISTMQQLFDVLTK